MVPLKYLSNFWRNLEMPLINCEINFHLDWSEKCVIAATDVANQGATFLITDTKLYVPVVTLSTQDNAKLLEQLKSGFKRTINWNKYQSKKINRKTKSIFRLPTWSKFQGSFQVFRLFVLSFQNEAQRTSHKGYYLPTVVIKNYVMIDGQTFLDQPVRNDLIKYDSLWKIAIGQGDDYSTGCLLDYNYFKKYKMIPIDLSKRQALHADPKAIKQINFTGNLENNAVIIFIIEVTKEKFSNFPHGAVKVLILFLVLI